MIILIAESKTMAACDCAVGTEELRRHTPAGERRADVIMASLAERTPDELAAMIKISPALAARMKSMVYEFPNKGVGAAAIEAYTGVVFRSFDFASLAADAKERVQEHVLIVSSLYGLLRPLDAVKPYRLDFATPSAPGGMPLARYWRESNTALLREAIEREGSGQVLDLMPAEAAKAIDMKAIAKIAEVRSAEFREMLDGGAMRTPRSNHLKTLRGHLLRAIVEQDIRALQQLTELHTDLLMPADDAGKLAFVC